jgi:hypothetical protein
VDVGQKHGTIAGRRYGTNSKRRPHPLAVDDHRSGEPLVSARYGVETCQDLLRAVRINAQDTCVVGSNKQTAEKPILPGDSLGD